MTVVPLPAILGTCDCSIRGRANRLDGRIDLHRSDCTIATEFAAGERAGDAVRYNRAPNVRPDSASEAFLAGWDRSVDRQNGVRYRGIVWDYPLRVSGRDSGRVDVHLDPVQWFRSRLESYIGYEPDPLLGFHESWEAPLSFLSREIAEDREPMGLAGDGIDDRSWDSIGHLEFTWQWPPRGGQEWTAQDTQDLHEALGLVDSAGNPLPVRIDPQGRAAPRPVTVDDAILPLPDVYDGRYQQNLDFAAEYLRAAADIRAAALAATGEQLAPRTGPMLWEAVEAAMPVCTGSRYLINPDAPEEGTDIHHDGVCPVHES